MVVERHILPRGDAIFPMVGEPQPRRSRARCPIHNGDSPTSLSLSEERGSITATCATPPETSSISFRGQWASVLPERYRYLG